MISILISRQVSLKCFTPPLAQEVQIIHMTNR